MGPRLAPILAVILVAGEPHGVAEGDDRQQHGQGHGNERLANEVKEDPDRRCRLRVGPDDVHHGLEQHQHHREDDGQQGDEERGLALDAFHVRAVLGVDAAGHGGRTDRNPFGGQPGEQRPADDDRGDGNEEAQRQRGAELGLDRADGNQGSGVRRHQSVQHGQAGQRGNGDAHQRHLGTLRHEDNHRQQQHQSDFEEHRQADDHRHQRDGPDHLVAAGLVQQGVHHPVGAAGVRQKLAEHRAEGDQQADLLQDAAHSVFEVGDDLGQFNAGRQAHEGRAEDERQEGVQLEFGDQHHDECDADAATTRSWVSWPVQPSTAAGSCVAI